MTPIKSLILLLVLVVWGAPLTAARLAQPGKGAVGDREVADRRGLHLEEPAKIGKSADADRKLVTIECTGYHYNSLTTTAYSPSVWNYDYSHYQVGATCKDSSGNTVDCSTSKKCGPDCWSVAGDFGGKTNECAGLSQTPIHLGAAEVDSSLRPPEFLVISGGCDKWVQLGDDHAFEVSFSETGHDCDNLKLKYQSTEYTLLQFHFHAPAEHVIASGLGVGAAELHMVHKSADGKLLVLGVIMQLNGTPIGGGSEFLNKFWKVASVGFEDAITLDTSCNAPVTLCSGTTSGSTITCSGTPLSSAVVGDTLLDTGNNCFVDGATITAIDGRTITMSTPTTRACASATSIQITPSVSSLVKKGCSPAAFVTAKEASVYAAVGASDMDGMCRYALEYEASGMDAASGFGPLDPYKDFLPEDKSFFTYSGSLTTYPCTEGVTWLVFEQPMFVSADDVKKIMAPAVCGAHTIAMLQEIDGHVSAWGTNRPLQPLGSRKLTKYDHLAHHELSHAPKADSEPKSPKWHARVPKQKPLPKTKPPTSKIANRRAGVSGSRKLWNSV